MVRSSLQQSAYLVPQFSLQSKVLMLAVVLCGTRDDDTVAGVAFLAKLKKKTEKQHFSLAVVAVVAVVVGKQASETVYPSSMLKSQLLCVLHVAWLSYVPA